MSWSPTLQSPDEPKGCIIIKSVKSKICTIQNGGTHFLHPTKEVMHVHECVKWMAIFLGFWNDLRPYLNLYYFNDVCKPLLVNFSVICASFGCEYRKLGTCAIQQKSSFFGFKSHLKISQNNHLVILHKSILTCLI
jgi:hypothetical protein